MCACGCHGVVDVVCNEEPSSLLDAFDRWLHLAESKACCDFGLQVAVTAWNDDVSREMGSLTRERGHNFFSGSIMFVLLLFPVQSRLYCCYFRLSHACAVVISGSVMFVLLLFSVQSHLYCCYFRFIHACAVVISGSVMLVLLLFLVQSRLYCCYFCFSHACTVVISGSVMFVLLLFSFQSRLYCCYFRFSHACTIIISGSVMFVLLLFVCMFLFTIYVDW